MQPTRSHSPLRPPPEILNLLPTLTLPSAGKKNTHRVNLPPLYLLFLADKLGELYEMVFPKHPEWLEEEVVDWGDEEDVASSVERFLERVNTLFPVHDEVWDADLDAIEWRLQEIPVLPMGYDLWYDDWRDLREPAPYLLHMRHSREVEEAVYGRQSFTKLYPMLQVPPGLELQGLIEPLRQLLSEERHPTSHPPELAGLPDLLQMLDHDTGNIWLDLGEASLAEGGGYPEWSRDNVEWLVAEWEQASPVLDRVMTLLTWKNESEAAISEKLSAVRAALLDAYTLESTS